MGVRSFRPTPMDLLQHWLWYQGNFLGIEWHVWKVVGWMGNLAFTARFLVQWYATERRREVVVPEAFWWLSIAGSWLLLAYAVVHKRDSVFIFANLFNWIPYVRNLVIQRRHERARRACSSCAGTNPPQARFCMNCGNPAAPVSGS